MTRETSDLVALAAQHRSTTLWSIGVACTMVDGAGSLVTHDESPKGAGRASVAAKLRSLGVESSFVVANPGPNGFDGALGAKLVMDVALREKLAKAILAVAQKESWSTIELDLESMPTKARDGYVALVRGVALGASGKSVVVDVHPKTEDDPGWDGPGAHDYRALVDAGAVLRLMTYDLSIGPVPPGPSTKASWVRDVVEYARKKGVPSEKLEIGLPAYGYDFPPKAKGAPVAMRYEEIVALQKKVKGAIVRDAGGTPHFSYDASDGNHEVWFDDAESLGRLLRELAPIAPHVRGVAIWGIGRSDPALVKTLAKVGLFDAD